MRRQSVRQSLCATSKCRFFLDQVQPQAVSEPIFHPVCNQTREGKPMPPVRLDQRRAGTLRPRRTAYDIRDRDLKGFGIRVAPSGRKTWFVHVRRDGERVWRTIGDAGAVIASEARARAMELLAVPPSGGAVPEDTILEAVAEDMFRHRARHWKPGTLEVRAIALEYPRCHSRANSPPNWAK